MGKITIKDIAKLAGVSITTVSRVLNEKTEGVSKQTREKVLKIIEDINFQPNQLARGLVTKRSKMIGLIVPNISNPFFPELCRGAEDAANEAQYSLIICNSDDQSNKEEHYIRLLREQQVDGVLLSSKDKLSASNEEILSSSKMPFVLLDRGGEVNEHSGIFLDNEVGGFLAGKHLTDLGHRDIACLIGPSEIQNVTNRLTGFRRALSEAGVALNESNVIQGNFQMDHAYENMKNFLEANRVTAVFACNDLMACGVYQAAHELNIQIPNQLSVVGFDDISLVNALVPKLTSVRQETYEMGKKAVELLIEQIETDKKQAILFTPTLSIKESTTSLKGAPIHENTSNY
ncbi:LacI family DNA-binding transcriptional regulator [Sporosarcina sp. CAU 1771]